jgi:hypothetical protein
MRAILYTVLCLALAAQLSSGYLMRPTSKRSTLLHSETPATTSAQAEVIFSYLLTYYTLLYLLTWMVGILRLNCSI